MILTSCGFLEDTGVFTLPSVKRVTGAGVDDETEKLKKKIKGYEREVDKKIAAGDRLGDLYEAIALKFLYRENWALAIEFYEKAISFGNSSSEVYRRLGSAYANRGRALDSSSDYDRALYSYNMAIEKKNDNFDARYGYALILHYVKGEKERALEMMEALVQDGPSFFEGRFAYARMLYEDGNPSAALTQYQTILNDLLNSKESLPESYVDDARQNIHRLNRELSAEQ